jgi:hypothetical protein
MPNIVWNVAVLAESQRDGNARAALTIFDIS